MRARHEPLLLLVASLGGCGGGQPSPDPESYREVSAQAALGQWASSEALSAPVRIEALGLTNAAQVVLGGGSTAFVVSSGAFEARALYAEGADPLSTGRIFGLAPRMEGGAWLAADAGVFFVGRLYTAKSGLSAARASQISAVARGGLRGVWIAGEDGLLRSTGAALERLSVPGTSGAATAVAVSSDGNSAFAVVGGKLVLLRAATAERITAELSPLEPKNISSVAAGSEMLYAATELGLIRWRASDAPAFTLLTLAPAGQPPTIPRALAVDGSTGAAWVLGAQAILEARLDGTLLSFNAPSSLLGQTSTAAMAVDSAGEVWVAAGSELDHYSASAGLPVNLSFERDLKPWITQRCAQCHSNQTADFRAYEVFAPRAETSLNRIRTGDMPRCEGGLVCPSGQRLTPADYAVLDQWIRAGKPN